MNYQLKVVRDRSYEEIQLSVKQLAEAYDDAPEKISCLLHCMQGKSDSFYAEIVDQYGVEIFFLKKKEGIFQRVLSKVLGNPALILVSNGEQVIDLLPKITEQGLGGAYFYSSVSTSSVMGEIKKFEFEPEDIVRSDPTHLIYLIDEDASHDSDKITEILAYGPECQRSLIAALNL